MWEKRGFFGFYFGFSLSFYFFVTADCLSMPNEEYWTLPVQPAAGHKEHSKL